MAQAQRGERFIPALPPHFKFFAITEAGITPRVAKMRAKKLAETFGTHALGYVRAACKPGYPPFHGELAIQYAIYAAHAAHLAGIGIE